MADATRTLVLPSELEAMIENLEFETRREGRMLVTNGPSSGAYHDAVRDQCAAIAALRTALASLVRDRDELRERIEFAADMCGEGGTLAPDSFYGDALLGKGMFAPDSDWLRAKVAERRNKESSLGEFGPNDGGTNGA